MEARETNRGEIVRALKIMKCFLKHLKNLDLFLWQWAATERLQAMW